MLKNTRKNEPKNVFLVKIFDDCNHYSYVVDIDTKHFSKQQVKDIALLIDKIKACVELLNLAGG